MTTSELAILQGLDSLNRQFNNAKIQAVMKKLDLQETKSGILLLVKAKPNSRRNEIRGSIDGWLKVAVTAIPEKGKANQAITKLLAKAISLPKGRIVLVAGATGSSKKFLITGIDAAQLRERLRNSLAED